jgi:hypothetical protein
MADNITDAEENRLLDLSIPTSGMYLALTSTAPTDAAAGTELTGNGYTRQAMATTAAASGSKTNSAQINYGPVTTADWLAILGYDVYDASTAGNRRWYRALAAGEQRTPKVGDTYRVAANALTFTLA